MISMRNVRCRASYHDRVDIDASNRAFVIYDLSRYNNRRHFLYTVTHDVQMTELKLCSRLPIYRLLNYIPMEDCNVHAVSEFEQFITPYKVNFSLLEKEYDVFALDDTTPTIEDIQLEMSTMFHSQNPDRDPDPRM